MRAAALCNEINWTINKNTIYIYICKNISVENNVDRSKTQQR